MLCQDLMKRDVFFVSTHETAKETARLMQEHNLGFLPVCDEHRTVLGAVTDRDLALRIVGEGRSSTTPVDEIMTREVVACHPHDDVHVAEERMAEEQKSRILCTDDSGHLVGIISLSDIAQREDARRVGDTIRRVTRREVTPS